MTRTTSHHGLSMLPFRSILCPVDFSAHASHALRYAAVLAGLAGAKLTVVWVTDPLLAQAAAVYVLDPHGEEARADLRGFVTETLPLEAPWLPEPHVLITVGRADQEILRIARQQQADLIVMGTHGLSGYRKMFFGSTTERVLRQTTMPVLAVPISESAPALSGDRPRLDAGTVVVAIDLGDGSQTLAVFGADLAICLGARPLFVHVVPPESAPPRWQSAVETHQRSALDRARQELSRLASETGDGSVETVVSAGNPAEEIATLATARHAGLIVMGLLSPTGTFGARPGSIAYRVLVLAPTPVLIVPPATAQVRLSGS